MFAHEIAQASSQVQPRWLRIPAACAYAGLPRSSLYRLMSQGVVKTVALCNRGKTRGIRLIDRLELDALLSSLIDKQTSETSAAVKSAARKRPAKDPRLSKAAATEVK